MAFHYQNILQERDLQYEGFEEQYQFILEYTKYRLEYYMGTHTRVTMRNLQDLAITSLRSKGTFFHKPFSLIKRQEKLLVVNNILFHNREQFLKSIFEKTDTTLESCYKLKNVLNELDRKDGDYLDSTMEGLVRYYIPAFDTIKINMNIHLYDEFIIWRLMELLYTSEDVVIENYQKIKKNMN